MWIIYALAASLCWGMSYAASGLLLKKGISPLVFFFGYSLFGLFGATICLISTGRFQTLFKLGTVLNANAGWYWFSIGIGALGAYLTYVAMGAKNPTRAALVEISYPLFVVLFTWIFFREMQLNMLTLCGGLLVLLGVAVIIMGEH